MMKNYIVILLLLFSSISYGQSNVKQLFKKHGVQGSTTIYNQNKRTWLYSDSTDATIETVPGSTFNILNAGIALESGALKTEKEVIILPKGKSDLQTAFQSNNQDFFEALANRVERKDYIEFAKGLNYGNHIVPSTGNSFWTNGTLKISPIAQINFLRPLLREQLSFSPRTFRIVKELMVSNKTAGYMLLKQSGSVTYGGKDYAWYIGAVKTKDNAFYFATRLVRNADPSKPFFDKIAERVTLDILKQIKVTD